MKPNKLVAGVVAGSLMAEVWPGHRRDQPHIHLAEYEWPQPAGGFAISGIEVVSTSTMTSGGLLIGLPSAERV